MDPRVGWYGRDISVYLRRLHAEGRLRRLRCGATGLEARQIVLDMLGERFGAVPDRVLRQVEEIESLDRLRFLVRKVMKAQSLAEIGLG